MTTATTTQLHNMLGEFYGEDQEVGEDYCNAVSTFVKDNKIEPYHMILGFSQVEQLTHRLGHFVNNYHDIYDELLDVNGSVDGLGFEDYPPSRFTEDMLDRAIQLCNKVKSPSLAPEFILYAATKTGSYNLSNTLKQHGVTTLGVKNQINVAHDPRLVEAEYNALPDEDVLHTLGLLGALGCRAEYSTSPFVHETDGIDTDHIKLFMLSESLGREIPIGYIQSRQGNEKTTFLYPKIVLTGKDATFDYAGWKIYDQLRRRKQSAHLNFTLDELSDSLAESAPTDLLPLLQSIEKLTKDIDSGEVL